MAIGDSYATPQDYRAHVSGTSTDQDVQIERLLKAVSRVIDRETGHAQTGFNKDASAVARIFTPDPYTPNARILYVPPMSAAPTSIKIDEDADGSFADETALASTDYTLEPADAALMSDAEPYREIHAAPWGAWAGGFPRRCRIEVTAAWGWPAVPEAIRDSTVRLAAVLRMESPFATESIPHGIDGAVQASGTAKGILRALRGVYVDRGAL